VTLNIGQRHREKAKLCNSILLEPSATPTSAFSTTIRPGCLSPHGKVTTDSCTSLEELWRSFYSAVCSQQIDRFNLERVGKLCSEKGVQSERIITAFQQWIKYQNAVASPGVDSLLVLVKFNVFRAFLNNGKKLGFSSGRDYLDDDALSPFINPMRPEESLPSLPLALRPTTLQYQTPHHPWLDLFPDPVMRDNLIQASNYYDQTELCSDLIGLSDCSTGRGGLIVWGEPWDPSSWEVTEPFLEHWGWTLRGCDELLRATNYWRQKRGEPSLRFSGL